MYRRRMRERYEEKKGREEKEMWNKKKETKTDIIRRKE